MSTTQRTSTSCPVWCKDLRQLADIGYALVVVTNQAGIAKGMYSRGRVRRADEAHARSVCCQGSRSPACTTARTTRRGAYRHMPSPAIAASRRPGMLLRAAAELGLDLSQSVLVGDKLSDAAAGRAAGVRWTVLVESGHRLPDETSTMADHRCADLAQATAWVCTRNDDPCPGLRP